MGVIYLKPSCLSPISRCFPSILIRMENIKFLLINFNQSDGLAYELQGILGSSLNPIHQFQKMLAAHFWNCIPTIMEERGNSYHKEQ
jgi:hypothetical protein